MALLRVERAGPLTTVQDAGRLGSLVHGVSASGPMDRGAFAQAGRRIGAAGGAGIEFTMAGIELVVLEGSLTLGWDGGAFAPAVNGETQAWPGAARMSAGDRLSITPGAAGNYGYLRFAGMLELPLVMGSAATSTRARLGGLEGRALRAGDFLSVVAQTHAVPPAPSEPDESVEPAGPIRFIWGLHAELFSREQRARFVGTGFRTTTMMDRMGVRLADEAGVFSGTALLSLVSDPIVPGDIQILGDGTPIVLMRDHQPTGGYPRIGTVISADLDRFAQIRPHRPVEFQPVSVDHAQRLLRSRRQ